ncbi:sensor histidine kinase [Frankia sp. AgW1.1]|uniref:sensor histidine kinase n=1 Tax=Frankia sp. AgW1.1 TaxID=1836971 RepID=UPI00193238EF|nr:sensor histidine kinase [Frankia sp. AgW1.1]MBL7494359.1 sensor histidine kinase [Frankia sp. AgW1.1]
MSRPRLVTAAIPLAAVAVAAAGSGVAVWARAGGTSGQAGAVSLAVTIVLITLAGCVLALARPDNRVGWVMAAAGAAWGVGEGGFDLAVRGIVTHPGSVAGAGGLAVVGASIRAAGWFGAAVAVPVVFPDGRLPGPRWRWLGYVAVAGLASTFVGTVLDAHVENSVLARAGWDSPVPAAVHGVGNLLSTLSLPLMAVTVVGSAAGMVRRWRRGDVRLRRQLLVFAAGVALPVVVSPAACGAGSPPWVFAVAVAPVPVAVAVAVLTGGVFDLATVANRSLVWGALSGSIVALYALVVAGTGAVLGQSGARWLPWLAAGAVAVSFAPLRAVLQDAANRITYGRWRTPYEVLAGLGARIEDAADTERVLGGVVSELYVTLGLTGAALRDSGGLVVAGTPGPGSVVVPLTAYGRHTGDLLYTEPATPLRSSDRRVLADLAAQLALLMHARSLTDDLQGARERLVLAREEERRRLRRDLHDGLGPALAGLMLKVDNARAVVEEDSPAVGRDLALLRDDIARTVVDVRRLVEGLRPPAIDELGLGPALAQAVDRLATRSGPAIGVTFADDLPALPAALEVALYRIVCEAVTNAVRHADAATCAVTVDLRERMLSVEIRDDGVGLRPPSSGGHGLATMRERAEELGGTLTIRADRAGTAITALLPLPTERTGEQP